MISIQERSEVFNVIASMVVLGTHMFQVSARIASQTCVNICLYISCPYGIVSMAANTILAYRIVVNNMLDNRCNLFVISNVTESCNQDYYC